MLGDKKIWKEGYRLCSNIRLTEINRDDPHDESLEFYLPHLKLMHSVWSMTGYTTTEEATFVNRRLVPVLVTRSFYKRTRELDIFGGN